MRRRSGKLTEEQEELAYDRYLLGVRNRSKVIAADLGVSAQTLVVLIKRVRDRRRLKSLKAGPETRAQNDD